MTESALRLIKRVAEFKPKEELKFLPRMLRGVYVLYMKRNIHGREKFDVQYVGMATAGKRRGLRGRLESHAKSKRKGKLWTHFSVFQVWDNIRSEEVAELEGLFSSHLSQRFEGERAKPSAWVQASKTCSTK